MKKLLTFSIFFLICLSGYGQSKSFTLKLNSDDTKFTLTYCGLRTTLNYNTDTSFAIVPNKDYTITKEIHATGFYHIMDGSQGHIIFIEPGDTININLKKKDSLYLKQENKEISGRALRIMIASSKHSGNLTFFDTYYNKIDYGLIPKLFEGWQDYPKRVTDKFNESIDLLQEFDDKGLVTADFKKFTKVYLETLYFSAFSSIFSYVKKENINKNYLSLIGKLSFTDSLFNETVPNYAAWAYVYVLYYNLNSFPVGEKDKHFKNLNEVYSTIKKSYTGVLKDQMLAWCMEDYAEKDCPSYDSIYNAFLLDCKNEKLRLSTISKITKLKLIAETEKVKKKAAPQFEFSKVLSDTHLKNIKGEKVKLQNILSDEIPTLIDCWASWCGPCISNIPTVKLIENKYKGKIKVLYLSFDNDELKWLNYLKTNPGDTKNAYIIENNFSSLFATFFNLKSIPRYIFLSHHGQKILDTDLILNYADIVIEKELNVKNN